MYSELNWTRQEATIPEILEFCNYFRQEDVELFDEYRKIYQEAEFQPVREKSKKIVEQYKRKLGITSENDKRLLEAILAVLFRDYWATEEQRKKIILIEKYQINMQEEQKRKEYNPDKILKNKKL